MVVDTKKEQEREEIHRSVWAIADALRESQNFRFDHTKFYSEVRRDILFEE